MMGVNSGLGPSVVYCWKCEKPVSLRRREWHELSTKDRLKFYLISLLYVAVGGSMGAVLLGEAYNTWHRITVPEGTAFYNSPLFPKAFVLAAVMVLSVLAFKIKGSLAAQKNNEERKQSSLYSPNFILGAQMKLLIVFCIPWLLSLIKNYFN
ncbi:MAG: hypothetical protein ACXWPX_09260 [Pseudobdellovibrio sp.]